MSQIKYDYTMDEDRVKLLIKHRKIHISDLFQHLKDDIEIAKIAVEYQPQVLQYLNEKLRDNKEIIMLALNLEIKDHSFDDLAAVEIQFASKPWKMMTN